MIVVLVRFWLLNIFFFDVSLFDEENYNISIAIWIDSQWYHCHIRADTHTHTPIHLLPLIFEVFFSSLHFNVLLIIKLWPELIFHLIFSQSLFRFSIFHSIERSLSLALSLCLHTSPNLIRCQLKKFPGNIDINTEIKTTNTSILSIPIPESEIREKKKEFSLVEEEEEPHRYNCRIERLKRYYFVILYIWNMAHALRPIGNSTFPVATKLISQFIRMKCVSPTKKKERKRGRKTFAFWPT